MDLSAEAISYLRIIHMAPGLEIGGTRSRRR